MQRPNIYTYQRVADSKIRTKNKTKPKLGRKMQAKPLPKLKIPKIDWAEVRGRVGQRAATSFTPDNVLAAMGAIIMSRAFILGELLPFIYAYFMAFGWKKRERSTVMVIFALLGFTTVLSGASLWANIASLLLLGGVIQKIDIPTDKTWWGMPALTASVIFLTKSILLIFTSVNFYQEMIIVFEALMAGILTYVLMLASEIIRIKKPLRSFSFEEMSAFVILGIGLVMGLNDVHLWGLGVSGIICRVGILIAAYLWGSSGGTMAGVMAGIVPSISSSIFAQSLGLYALSGLLAGVFKNFGRLGVIIGFMMGNLAISMFISENQAAMMGIWETGIASLVFFLLPETLRSKVPVESLGPAARFLPEFSRVEGHLKADLGVRIQNLAEVFDELSSTFVTSTESASPHQPIPYLNYLYEELANGFCEGCSRYGHCWERYYIANSEQLMEIFTMAEEHGQVTFEKAPPTFQRRCVHGRELISTVNYLFDNLRVNEYWSGKIDESRELVATQLKGVSEVVRNLAQEIEVDTTVDFELRTNLLMACSRQGICVRDITPIRNSTSGLVMNVAAPACADGTSCHLQLAPAISSLVGEKLEVGDKKCPRLKGQGDCEFTLMRGYTYEVQSAVAQVARESISGDSYLISTLPEGKVLAVLSDGMGVGATAASQSQTAVNLLENLLKSGFTQEVALKTINSVLLLRSTNESFTTLDMVMIDLYSAEVDFIKTASAPSFIKRGRQVASITSSSLPIGILNEVQCSLDTKNLLPRDLVVMVTDGVLDAGRSETEWVSRLLADLDETDPQLVAETVINQAVNRAQGKPHDDLTVICLRLELRG